MIVCAFQSCSKFAIVDHRTILLLAYGIVDNFSFWTQLKKKNSIQKYIVPFKNKC